MLLRSINQLNNAGATAKLLSALRYLSAQRDICGQQYRDCVDEISG
jgi:hypothetical protein